MQWILPQYYRPGTSNNQFCCRRCAVYHCLSRAHEHPRLAQLSIRDHQVADILLLNGERQNHVET